MDGTVLVWNKGSEEFYGYTSDEMVGKEVLFVYPSTRASELKSIIDKIKSGEHVVPYVTQRKKKDGSLVDVAIRASPIRDEKDEIVEYIQGLLLR